MAYKKRTYRRKRPYRYRRRRGNFNYKVKKALMYMSPKQIPVTVSNEQISSTGTIFQITNIATGTTNATREGQKINPSYLSLKWSVTMPSAEGSQRLRFIVFQWFNDTAEDDPTFVDLLQDNSTTQLALLSPFNKNNQEQRSFRILYDRTLTWNQQLSSTATAYPIQKVYIKSNRLRPCYYSSSTASTATKSGGIYMGVFSDSESVAHPTLNVNGRMGFFDI